MGKRVVFEDVRINTNRQVVHDEVNIYNNGDGTLRLHVVEHSDYTADKSAGVDLSEKKVRKIAAALEEWLSFQEDQ